MAGSSVPAGRKGCWHGCFTRSARRVAERVNTDFPNAIFFTTQLILRRDNWFVRQLHNHAALVLQRRFHLRGMQMVILPVRAI